MKKTISGIRGVVGADLGIKDVINFCTNFADLTGGECVTGMDTRPSSEMITRAVHAGLMYGGVSVRSLGMVPTPVTFREARRSGAGVMVTSSHNPVQWNGLKFILNGRGINESELPRITGEPHGHAHHKDGAGDTAGHAAEYGHGRPESPTVVAGAPQSQSPEDATSAYIEEAAAVIGDVAENIRILVDAGGGAAVHVAPRLYERIGCSASVINAELNSRGPDPTSDSLSDLASGTSGTGCDIGFAFDLDGDRLVIVIDGEKQTPDATLGLGVAGALDMGCTDFVLSTDTSLGVERLISSRGCTSTKTRVGEANVVDEMIRRGAHAGGEGSSGGFILPEFNYCRDGILAGGMIAGMSKSTIKETLEELGRYHTVRTKIHAGSDRHHGMIERITRWMESECSEVDELDGIKGIVDENSWILVRRSNTEDAIRISAEAGDASRCSALVDGAYGIMSGR